MEEINCRIWTKDGYQDLIKHEWLNIDNNTLHRLDGPAIEYDDGTKKWMVDGKLHRLDGPAIEYNNGTKKWWIGGEHLPTEEIEEWLEENKINLKTQEGQTAFKLRWM